MAAGRPVQEQPLEKEFNDPIHGYIVLHPLPVRIMETPHFHRLRKIKPPDIEYSSNSSVSTNRFTRSIRMAYLARQLAEALRTIQPELIITDRDILCVQIAGLCHDLGHGPFSHLFDGPFLKKIAEKMINEGKTEEGERLKNWKHEQGSCDMFDYLVEKNNLRPVMKDYGLMPEEDLKFIKEMILMPYEIDKDKTPTWPYEGRGEDKAFLYDIVSNKSNGVDVDKFDYLARDSYHLGIKNNFDHSRYIKLARVCEVNGRKRICMRDTEVDNMYDLFYTRHCLHRRAYQHKVSSIIEHMIVEAFVEADGHIKLEGSEGNEFTLSTAMKDMEAYTKLTDNVFDQILNSTEVELTRAREILQNIVSSKIPKFLVEIRPKEDDMNLEKLRSDLKELLADHFSPEDLDTAKLITDFKELLAQHFPHENFDVADLISGLRNQLAQQLSEEDWKDLKLSFNLKKLLHQHFHREDFDILKLSLDLKKGLTHRSDEGLEVLKLSSDLTEQQQEVFEVLKLTPELKAQLASHFPNEEFEVLILAQHIPQEEFEVLNLSPDLKIQLAQHLPLKPENFEVLDIKMEDKDPVEHMFFYSMSDPDKAEKITGDQASRIRTTCFSEKLIRVYYKKTDKVYIIAKENLEK